MSDNNLVISAKIVIAFFIHWHIQASKDKSQPVRRLIIQPRELSAAFEFAIRGVLEQLLGQNELLWEMPSFCMWRAPKAYTLNSTGTHELVKPPTQIFIETCATSLLP